MIRSLPHRCTVWRPTASPADPVRPAACPQGKPAAYAIGADNVRCRYSARDSAAPRLLLARDTVIDQRDRITAIRHANGDVIDAGPFAVAPAAGHGISGPSGRVRLGYRRATLRRLIALDQE